MNGRKLFREYAQSKGKEAKEFVKIEDEQYQYDTLITKDDNGKEETTNINYKDMVTWMIRKLPNGA
jgi:cytidylate kinase